MSTGGSGLVRVNWLEEPQLIFIREAVKKAIPTWHEGARAFQVNATARALNGRHQLNIIPCSGGKTALMFLITIVIRELHAQKLPWAVAGRPAPKNPLVLSIGPLKELQNNQALDVAAFGIKALAINEDTVMKRPGGDMYREVKACNLYSLVLVGPERLGTAAVEDMLRDLVVGDNLVACVIDELHSFIPWGENFRKPMLAALRILRRLPDHVPFIGMTGTLPPADLPKLRDHLNLRAPQLTVIRESCERANLQLEVRELSHSLAGYTFPDVRETINPGGKSIVYVQTLELAYRVPLYLWSLLPPGAARRKQVRVFTSLTSADENKETVALFRDDPDCRVVVGTIAYGMGADPPAVRKVYCLGTPKTLNDLIQEINRAGRSAEVSMAEGIVMVERSIGDLFRPLVIPKARKPTRSKKDPAAEAAAKRNAKLSKMEAGMKMYLEAGFEGGCLVVAQNTFYENPGSDSLRTCLEAKRASMCSSCKRGNAPMPSRPEPPSAPAASVRSTPLLARPGEPVLPLEQRQREHIDGKLRSLAARAVWSSELDIDEPTRLYMSVNDFFPATFRTRLIDNILFIRDHDDVNRLLQGWPYVEHLGSAILATLLELAERHRERALKKKRNTVVKASHTREKNKRKSSSLGTCDAKAAASHSTASASASASTLGSTYSGEEAVPSRTASLPRPRPRPAARCNSSQSALLPGQYEPHFAGETTAQQVMNGPINELHSRILSPHRANTHSATARSPSSRATPSIMSPTRGSPSRSRHVRLATTSSSAITLSRPDFTAEHIFDENALAAQADAPTDGPSSSGSHPPIASSSTRRRTAPLPPLTREFYMNNSSSQTTASAIRSHTPGYPFAPQLPTPIYHHYYTSSYYSNPTTSTSSHMPLTSMPTSDIHIPAKRASPDDLISPSRSSPRRRISKS